jgi:hypothetical protein
LPSFSLTGYSGDGNPIRKAFRTEH